MQPIRRRWFLPDSPDLLGLLRRHLEVIVAGMEAFAAWAAGDQTAGQRTHELEHKADKVKRELSVQLREAFTTPFEPEDLFALSHGADWVLNHAKDVVAESELMACPPDEAVAEMAVLLAGAMREVTEAIDRLGSAPGDPIESADAAIKSERKVEKVYRRAMASLLEVQDLRDVIARRELYRRCSRIGEAIVEVAERVEYAVAKES